jgi:hypothetical protein
MDEVLNRLAPFGTKPRSAGGATPPPYGRPGGNGDVAPLPPAR